MENVRFPIFAQRFFELRGARSQEDFAEFLGLSRPTVSFYENGLRIPDALVLRQIAQRCQVSTDWLLGLTEAKAAAADVQQVCNLTGLSEGAVEEIKEAYQIHGNHSFLVRLIDRLAVDAISIDGQRCVVRAALAQENIEAEPVSAQKADVAIAMDVVNGNKGMICIPAEEAVVWYTEHAQEIVKAETGRAIADTIQELRKDFREGA